MTVLTPFFENFGNRLHFHEGSYSRPLSQWQRDRVKPAQEEVAYLPVIHARFPEQVRAQLNCAYENGADGAFVINQGGMT